MLYPQLPDHPGHAAAAKQMRDFGGMVSFTVRGGEEAASGWSPATELFTLAESLGAVESLIEHPGAMTHASAAGSPLEVPDNLIRLSVGIELGRPRRRPRAGAWRGRWSRVIDEPPSTEDGATLSRHLVHDVGRPIVVAANRLPVTRTPSGWTPSPGGLVRALLPLLRTTGGTWVGWTAAPTTPPNPSSTTASPSTRSPSPRGGHPLLRGLRQRHVVAAVPRCATGSTYNGDDWSAYQQVNERFAEAVADVAPDGRDRVGPGLPPAARAAAAPGTAPGPPDRVLLPHPVPAGRAVHAAALADGDRGRAGACDLVGFQRRINATNFEVVCQELLGVRPRAGAYPISIDVDEMEAVAAGRAIRQQSNRLRTRLGEPEVVLLGVDRLDYTKGISQRLRAFQSLLDDGTLDVERAVMVQVATPTREGVEHYQNERREIEQLVGEINGVHGRIGHPALHYQYRNLPLDELVALYRTGDVMLVTPFATARATLKPMPSPASSAGRTWENKSKICASDWQSRPRPVSLTRRLTAALPVHPQHRIDEVVDQDERLCRQVARLLRPPDGVGSRRL